MPLRGTIQGFPIPDLLQFLASGQSTGVLHVYEDEDTKHVAFREGEIVFITYQKPVPQLDELIRHGDVSAPSNSKSANRAPQWDQVITRALVRRRLVPYQRSGDSRRALKRLMMDSEAELATFLLAQGRLTNETLGELLHGARPVGSRPRREYPWLSRLAYRAAQLQRESGDLLEGRVAGLGQRGPAEPALACGAV